MLNIGEVARRGLCTQCTFCAGLCPASAITLRHDPRGNLVPRVEEGRCTHCRLCVDICAGHRLSLAQGDTRADLPLGIWTGHARDPSYRRQASSGGVVGATLARLLERGEVDQASCISPEGPFPGHRMHLTGSPTRILAGSGSVYLPVDLAQAVREAAGEGGSLAVAGLPCHIHAWRKAARRIPTLGRRLKVTIGIFCDHRIDLSYLRLLLGLHRIPFAAVTAVRFRGEGWPGSIRIELEGGGAASIPYADPVRKLLWKAYVGTPRRCLLCPDALADAADIAAGDAWLPEFAGDTLGTNLVVARTPVGRDLLGILAGDGTLALAPAPPDALARSQRVQLLTKGAWLSSRLLLARLTGGAVPVLDLPRPGPRWSGLAAGSLAFAIAAASRRPLLGRALGFLPWRRLAGAIFFGGAGS